MQKRSKIIIVAAILIVVGLLFVTQGPQIHLFSYVTSVSPATINAYTGSYSFTDGSHPVHDKINGKKILQGTASETMSSPYAMDASGNSAQITLTTSNVYTWGAGHDYIVQSRRPSVLFDRYYWVGTYYAAGVDPNTGSGTTVFSSSSTNSNYVSVSSGTLGARQTFASLSYSYSVSGRSDSFATAGSCPLDYSQTATLSTNAVSFKMVGYHSGTLKVQLYVEYVELCVWGSFNSVYGYGTLQSKVVKTDIADLSAAPSYVYTVSSTPTGASVSVGGKTGTTPTTFTLTAGTYTVTMTKTGYDTKTYSLSLTAAKTDAITLTQTAVTYAYTVKTSPTSCSVTISGTTKDSDTTTGAVFTLAKGTYSVSISKSGYTTLTYSVTLSAALTDTKTLTATGGGGGGGGGGGTTTYAYTVKTTPTSCDVTISGSTINSGSSGAVFTLAASTYSVSVSKTGYTTTTYSVSISAAKTDTVTLTANPTTFYYTVKTSPTSSSVTIGSMTKDSGTTGAVFPLLSGTYSVSITKSGYNTNTYSVSISADKTDTITMVMSNQKPITPSISYPNYHEGYIGNSQPFELNAWDNNPGEQLQYHMDWGDGIWTAYTDFTNEMNAAKSSSDSTIITKASKQVTHAWSSSFSGSIRAQSKDAAGLESDIYTYAWSAVEKPNYDLTINTNPDGCDVSISGYGGQTTSGGSTTFTLPMGSYTVSCSKSGYVSDSASVDLSEGSKSVTFELEIITYRLTVTTNPTGCDVTFNSQSKNSGTSGAVFTGVLPGIYPVTVSKQGYVAVSEQVTIIDTDKSLTEILDPIKVTLKVITIPANCDVTIQGLTINSGTTGALFNNMVAGTYSIQASKQYYTTAADTATIVDVAVTKTMTLAKSNFNLTVIPSQTGSMVTVDGMAMTGASPTFRYLVKGSHVVQVSKIEFVTNTTTIDLEADTTLRVHITGQTYPLTVNTVPSDCTVSVLNGPSMTSSNGVAVFNLEKNTYQVTAMKTGYTFKTQTITTKGPANLSFFLTSAHTVTIMTEPGNCTVIIKGVDTKTSDANGRAIFFNVEEKSYNVTISKEGYTDFSSPMTINSDATYTYSLTKRTVQTPGFELISLVVAVGIAAILLKRRKK